MISLIIILAICCLSSFCLLSLSGGTYYEYSRNDRSYIIPSSFYFESKPGYKYIGYYIKKLDNRTKNECLGECLQSPYCVGVTYDSSSKQCDIQAQSYKTDIEFATELEGKIAYARNDPKKRIERINGKANTSSYVTEKHNVNSLNECVEKCIGAKDNCISANYYSGGVCHFMKDLEKDDLTNKSDATFFYQKGIPGGYCEKSDDCVYGYCENNTCLNRSPLEPRTICKSDRECINGYCDSIDISYLDQKENLQELIESNDSDAKLCYGYKTINDCMETPINRAGQSISAGLCEWRSPNKNPKFENITCQSNELCPPGLECQNGKCKCTNQSCSGYCIKDTCFNSGEEGTCFPLDLKTYYKECR